VQRIVRRSDDPAYDEATYDACYAELVAIVEKYKEHGGSFVLDATINLVAMAAIAHRQPDEVILGVTRDFLAIHRGEMVPGASVPRAARVAEVKIVYTCEDHGRCVGCPKVLAQFDAIAREQGVDTMIPEEVRAWDDLRTRFGKAAS
jgi:ferredoxin